MAEARVLGPGPWALPAIGTTGVLVGVWRAGVPVHREDDLIEALGLVLLLLVAAAAVRAIVAARRPEERLAGAGLTLLALTAVLRELDTEWYDLPGWLVSATSGTGRDVGVGSAWLLAAVGAWRLWRPLLALVRREARRPSGRLLLVGAGCYVAAQLLESPVTGLTGPTRMFLEELVELVGSWYLFGGSLAFARGLARLDPQPDGGPR